MANTTPTPITQTLKVQSVQFGARRKPTAEAALAADLAELQTRFNPQGDKSTNTLLDEAFHGLMGCSLTFLRAAKAFEDKHKISVSSGGSPKRYYYEAVDTALTGQQLDGEQRKDLEAVRAADIAKCHAVIACVNTARTILRERDGAEPSLFDAHKIAGSMVRKALDHIKVYHSAEINYCKNPDVRVLSDTPHAQATSPAAFMPAPALPSQELR